MIQARKLGHVVLNVRNSQRSKLFYMQVLGLRLVHEDPQRREVFLSFGREHHELGLFEATVAGPGDDAARSVLHHTAWQLGNDAKLRAAYERESAARALADQNAGTEPPPAAARDRPWRRRWRRD